MFFRKNAYLSTAFLCRCRNLLDLRFELHLFLLFLVLIVLLCDRFCQLPFGSDDGGNRFGCMLDGAASGIPAKLQEAFACPNQASDCLHLGFSLIKCCIEAFSDIAEYLLCIVQQQATITLVSPKLPTPSPPL